MSFPRLAGLSCLLTGLFFSLSSAQEAKKHTAVKTQPVMNVGMAKGFFTDISSALIQFGRLSFGGLMKQCTGLDGQLVVGGDYQELSRDLRDGKLDVAVYHGFEYAWAREADPQLHAMMIAINYHRQVCAYLVTRQDGNFQGIGDLKGKEVAYPFKSKEHCRLFRDKLANGDPLKFFGKVTRSKDTFVALDDVLKGSIPAAVVDRNSFDTYADLYPGRAARLKIAIKSETFPAAVIVHHNGKLGGDNLKKFRDGMIAANKNPQARDIMHMFNVTAFEPIPDDYEQTLTDIIKTYPRPGMGN